MFFHVNLWSKILSRNVASFLYSSILPFNFSFRNFEVSVPLGLNMATCVFFQGYLKSPVFAPVFDYI